jgi:hypothetical protein
MESIVEQKKGNWVRLFDTTNLFVHSRRQGMHRSALALSLLLFVLPPERASGQRVDSEMVRAVLPVTEANVHALSIDQDNLLVRQLLVAAPLRHTTIREFSFAELDPAVDRRVWSFDYSRATFTTNVNTAQAYSEDDGVVWSGRGVTGVAMGGAVARWYGLSAALRPVAFWTQNASFNESLTGESTFLNPVQPNEIDYPWRFGNRSYARLDPGESWLRFDSRFLSGGLSSTTQEWGPAHIYPLLLGPNAGGFPHLFVGSGAPVPIGIGTLAVRWSLGRLDPSGFEPSHIGDQRRIGVGAVASFAPYGLNGLEVGGGRFFHRRWPAGGIGTAELRLPFEAVLKAGASSSDPTAGDNQLADLFFRLSPPRSGVELYGEFLRDDHSFDTSDLIGEPDHESAYMLGIRKVWTRPGVANMRMLTAEIANGRLSQLSRLREEVPMYIHSSITEGHTERGQLLGSPAIFGGGGFAVIYSDRAVTGGWTAEFRNERTAQNQEGGTWNGSMVGFTLGQVSRYWRRGTTELEVGAGLQQPWDRLAGRPNVVMHTEISWIPR